MLGCPVLCSAYAEKNKHFKKDTEYNCRKIILDTRFQVVISKMTLQTPQGSLLYRLSTF